jgi:hypothetical protein
MHDSEPETVDVLLATLGDCVERLLKSSRLARECRFAQVEAEIHGELELTHKQLLLALCAAPDGEPQRHIAAMVAKVAAALGTGAGLLTRTIAAAALSALVGFGVGGYAAAHAETLVLESTIGRGACPDLEFLKREDVLSTQRGPPPTEEEAYQHHCYTFNSINNLGLDVIANEGKFIKIRPCGWTESFWMFAPKEPVKYLPRCPQ